MKILSVEECSFEQAYNIGNRYELGIEIEKDLQKAITYLEKAEKEGCIIARAKLGECYKELEGDIVEGNKSFNWYKKGCDGDDAVALSVIGNYYNEKFGYDIASWTQEQRDLVLDYYKRAQSHGCSIAMCGLGQIYMANWDGKDENKAFDYLLDSANRNMAVAQYEVSKCYYYGIGVEKDINKAIEFCIKDAMLKDPEAIGLLGEMYSSINDYEKAKECLKVAAKMKNPTAIAKLIELYEDKKLKQCPLFKSIKMKKLRKQYEEALANKEEYIKTRGKHIVKYRDSLRREALGCDYLKVAEKFRK